MIETFTLEQRSQHEWAWLLAFYLFLGSLGGALFLLFWFFQLPLAFAAAALGLVLLGAIILLIKLGSPWRAWRACFRPSTSWISRGVLFVCGFFLFTGLFLAPALLSRPAWNSGLTAVFGWLAAAFALLTALYPGFVLSTSRAISFWRTPLLPLLLFGQALLAATGVVLLALPASGQPIETLASALIAANIVLLAIYLFVMAQAGGSARESVRRLNQAPLNVLFWLGVVVLGLLAPLLAIVWGEAKAWAGAGLLLGGFLFRYCVLKAGVYDLPAALIPANVDFSRLNRSSADLAREYASTRIVSGRR